MPDDQGRSRCDRLCAVRWPPLLLSHGAQAAVAGPGVRAALLGTTRRSGGALQVTYNRWPLYLFAGDQAPGEASGQADDMGLWYAVSPDGSIDRQPLPAGAS